MSWRFSFLLRQSLRESLLLVPFLGGVAGGLLGLLTLAIDRAVGAPARWHYSASLASAVLSTVIGTVAALAGFVITVSVLAVQVVTSILSARYLRFWYGSTSLRVVLTALIGTLTLAFALLRRTGIHEVPALGVAVAGSLVIVNLALFLFFFNGLVHLLRPVAVAASVGAAGRRALQAMVGTKGDGLALEAEPGVPTVLVVRGRRAGSIQAVDRAGLVEWARQHRCLVVLPHVVGDFVSSGALLLEVRGGTPDPAWQGVLENMVVLGIERAIPQDPAFALRIMVDIASKALSAAINDPTTAVQVLDHLDDLLRAIGTSELTPWAGVDGEGQRRVWMPSRRWEDYLALGVTEIREYGASAIQVMRRLLALLTDLREVVLPAHRAAVDEEIRRLEKTVTRALGESADLDRARIPDRQGMGGPRRA